MNDLTDPVEFTGEKVAEVTTFQKHKGAPTDRLGTVNLLPTAPNPAPGGVAVKDGKAMSWWRSRAATRRSPSGDYRFDPQAS